MSKIGIMGGTFNPIHIAHLMIAEVAYYELELDEVWFMPSKNPPHKQNEQIVDDEHRVQMVELAIENNPHFIFSSEELKREGLTYTVDTLKELVRKYPDNDYYFIIGGDSLFKFNKWKEPAEILKLTTIVAFGRDHVADEQLLNRIEELKRRYQGDIIYIKAPNMDISSSLIRDLIKANKSIRYYVPKEVEDYIMKEKLYKV